ncbi:hypothetical protein HP436_12105 [Pseudomonas sp. CrR14]|nr:hypothetical protein [Pseudomonas sp. CrR14]
MEDAIKAFLNSEWSTGVGLLITMAGFAITIYQLWKTRAAAESATFAAKEARRIVFQAGVIANFSSAVTAMEELKRLQRAGAWEIMPDRYSSLRKMLISIIGADNSMTDQHRKLVQSSISQFREIEGLIEEFISSNKDNPPDPAKLNKIITQQLDKLDEVLAFIKTDVR